MYSKHVKLHLTRFVLLRNNPKICHKLSRAVFFVSNATQENWFIQSITFCLLHTSYVFIIRKVSYDVEGLFSFEKNKLVLLCIPAQTKAIILLTGQRYVKCNSRKISYFYLWDTGVIETSCAKKETSWLIVRGYQIFI